MLRRNIVLVIALLVGLTLSACGETPTPDVRAIETQTAAKIFATQTAGVPSQTPTPEPTATPGSTGMLQPTATPEPTNTPKATNTSLPAPTVSSPQAAVQSATLNVRAGPGTTHPTIASLKQGQTVPVTGRDTEGSWLMIQLPDGSTGWVSRSLVRLNPATEEIAVAESIPTAPAPVPTRTPAPAAGKQTLEVVYMNLHYECQLTEWISLVRVWGYRSFQADMFIKNNSQTPVQPPWKPQRWIITDGVTEHATALIWEWGHVQTGLFNQPLIAPGQSAGWTFMAFPIERNEWVKAVEFVWQGQVYRTEFDRGTFGNAYDYKDCGEYPPVTGPRVPVPVDTPVAPGSGSGQPGGTPEPPRSTAPPR